MRLDGASCGSRTRWNTPVNKATTRFELVYEALQASA